MNQERRQLKLDLHYFFVDKHKNVWFFQSVDMESLAVGLKDNSDHKNSEHFYEFLRVHPDFFCQQNLCYKGFYLSQSLWCDPK